MLGLCHTCLSSGVELFVTKGHTHCSNTNCTINKKTLEDPPEYQAPIEFEDLPQADLLHRSDHAYEVAAIYYKKELMDKIAEDRKFNTD